MKAEQDPRINMNDNLDDLQKDFEKAAKDRIDELKSQADRDSDTLKDEVKDLKDEADNSLDNYKSELGDLDDPYKDEKIAVEEESNKVVKKEIDLDYDDSIDRINMDKDHRIDSIERIMDEDIDYDKGVDAIYLNQSEDKFQHQKDHYADRKASDYSDHIKASYDDIQEVNSADRIKDFTTGNSCKAPHSSTKGAMNNLKETSSDYSKNHVSSSANKTEDYKEMYGSSSCKSGVESNSSINNLNEYAADNKDRFKATSPNQVSDGSQENIQSNISSSIEQPDSITEEYFVVITDNYVDDDNYTYECGCGSAPTDNSSMEKENKPSNQYGEQSKRNYSGSTQGIYSENKQSQSNNTQNKASQGVKNNACDYDLKQDILDEADRIMGDDVL